MFLLSLYFRANCPAEDGAGEGPVITAEAGRSRPRKAMLNLPNRRGMSTGAPATTTDFHYPSATFTIATCHDAMVIRVYRSQELQRAHVALPALSRSIDLISIHSA